VLPQYLKRTEWAFGRATKQDMIEKTRAEFASHEFVPPEAGSFSFMLSKQGYLNDVTAGPWLPHVLHGQTSIWAAGIKDSPILGSDSGPSNRRWYSFPFASGRTARRPRRLSPSINIEDVASWCRHYALRNRSALLMTETDEKLIASAAISGDSNSPKTG